MKLARVVVYAPKSGQVGSAWSYTAKRGVPWNHGTMGKSATAACQKWGGSAFMKWGVIHIHSE